MSAVDPAVLVAPGGAGAQLRELLGAERSAALEATLDREVERWAAEVTAGPLLRAEGPLAAATAATLAEHGGPLLVVWPVLARFRAEHASGALGDLESGCELSVGPVIDGGLYLLGLSRPLGELLPVPDEAWIGSDAMSTALRRAGEAGLEVGLLRAERALRAPSDVRAALADPLTPNRIGRILRG